MENKGQFQPGHKGGPGRPKGSRNKLEEDFLKLLHDDWVANGASVIERVRSEDPSTYMRIVAQVLPKESKVDVEHSGAIEHRGLPEIGSRVGDLLASRADSDSSALLPH